ncbi:hypothetical protein GCM10009624_07240 [Gordonia sinesedis]
MNGSGSRRVRSGVGSPAAVVWVIAVITLCLALVAGCSSTEAQRSKPVSSSAQTDLPAPVPARADAAGAPTSLIADGGTAPIEAVASDVSGALLPPQDVNRLGWWVDSALPGSGAGTVVVTGHVDEARQGTGFAARFATMNPGDEVRLDTEGAGSITYRVQRIQNADKTTQFPAAELNRLDGPETLALVTCGGPFVGGALGYRDNVIAWATRV